MKRLMLIAFALTLTLFLFTVQSQSNDEREAVRQAVLDYVEGVYNVDPSRIERSVHPELAKRGFWRERGKDGYTSGKMTYPELIEVAKTLWLLAAEDPLEPDANPEVPLAVECVAALRDILEHDVRIGERPKGAAVPQCPSAGAPRGPRR